MTQQKVEESDRIKRRRVANALGNDPVRYLVELITNADDSYRRLENGSDSSQEYKDSVKPILIIYNCKDQGKEYFEVVDNAEGMSKERLEQVFGVYAGDNAEGEKGKTRGIFGQGASDVLKGAAIKGKRAQIISLKDGAASKLRYLFENNDFYINTTDLSWNVNQEKSYREKYGIKENGTIITFGLPDGMKVNPSLLKTQLETNYMFHYLLAQDNRAITLRIVGKGGKKDEWLLSSRQYSFESKTSLIAETLLFEFDGETIHAQVSFYENNSKDADGIQLIVRDENFVVFDNTMFGRERSPALQSISGELTIFGFYELCKKHLNKADDPDAIVSDNRTGFDVKNPFYKALQNAIDPILSEVIKRFGKKPENTDLTKNKKFGDVLRKINEYLREELEEEIGGGNATGVEPPASGLSFARDNIAITKGKKYSLRLYINANIVPAGSEINISIESTPYVDLETAKVSFTEEDADENGLVIKNVQLVGNEITPLLLGGVVLQAKIEDMAASCYITVVDASVHYPENGIEFWPKKVRAKESLPHKAYLYVDTNTIPTGSTITFSCDSGLCLDQDHIEVASGQLVGESGVAKIEVISTGGELGEAYEIVANFEEKKAEAQIRITANEQEDEGSSGLIRGIELTELGPTLAHVDAYIDDRDGILRINKKSTVNILNLDMENLSAKSPRFKPVENKYLANIISEQVAYVAFRKKESNLSRLPQDNPLEAYDKMRNEVLVKKTALYGRIYQSFAGVNN